MSTRNSKKLREFQGKRILWIDPTPLDVFLHQASSLEIIAQMAKRGHRLVLIVTRSRNVVRFRDPKVRIIAVPLRLVPLLSSVVFAVGLFLFLPFHLAVSKPDFVVVSSPLVSILGLLPGLLFSKIKPKYVLDVRSIPVETTGFRGSQQKFWFNVSILVAKKLFDGMTTITSSMMKDVGSTFAINPRKMGIWSSGVNTELFDPRNYISESMRLKRKLGLSGKFVVFYHGAFTATRGLKETIESMKILSRECSNVTMLLLGTGPIVFKLKQLVRERGLQDRVIVHDPVEYREVPKFIEMSDVCIIPLPDHPYWISQRPLKLLEYLAMEKVVVVTDIFANRSVIADAKCGIYMPSIAPNEIAKSIMYAYDNKDKLAEWGKTGRSIVEQRHTWEKIAEDLDNYLLSIDDTVTRIQI